jgi:hypothetical protein
VSVVVEHCLVLQRLSLVCRVVDDLFLPNSPDFRSFMYQDKTLFYGDIYLKVCCELNSTS